MRLALIALLCTAPTQAPPPSYVTAPMLHDEGVGNASPEYPVGEESVSLVAEEGAVAAAPPQAASKDVAALLSADLTVMAQIAPWIAEHVSGSAEARYDTSMRVAWAVARWSRNNGIRPELVTALIYHESRFNPRASSPTNDHGLMQLHGRRIYGIEENVQAGCAHFAGNLKAAKGDEYRALCCYNGGPRGPGYGQCQRYARRVLGTAKEVQENATAHQR